VELLGIFKALIWKISLAICSNMFNVGSVVVWYAETTCAERTGLMRDGLDGEKSEMTDAGCLDRVNLRTTKTTAAKVSHLRSLRCR